MSELQTLPHSRPDYMTSVGFALFTDVNEQIMDRITPLTPARVEGTNLLYNNRAVPSDSQLAKRRSNFALMLVTNSMARCIPDRSQVVGGGYGVSFKDRIGAGMHDVHEHGFGDTDFPWHFSAGLASNVVDSFVSNGNLPAHAARNMTLSDWANIVGTGWFSDLCHSLAFASNGFYNIFGKNYGDYAHNGFLKHVAEKLRKPEMANISFDITEKAEPVDGYTYLTAQANPLLLKAIRGTMPRDRSAGCPVARRATRLLPSMLTEDPHTKNLIALERLKVIEGTETEDTVRVGQDYSAIDHSLAVLALKLEEYDALYGTPRISRNQGSLVVLHQSRASIAEPFLRTAA